MFPPQEAIGQAEILALYNNQTSILGLLLINTLASAGCLRLQSVRKPFQNCLPSGPTKSRQGTPENSPTIYRWVPILKKSARPLSRNDAVRSFGVRGRSAAATPLWLLLPVAAALTEKCLHPKSADGVPSPQGREFGVRGNVMSNCIVPFKGAVET